MGNLGPHHSSLSIRIPDEIIDAIKALASQNGTSVNDVAVSMIYSALQANAELFTMMRQQAYSMAVRLVQGVGPQLPETLEQAIADGWLPPMPLTNVNTGTRQG